MLFHSDHPWYSQRDYNSTEGVENDRHGSRSRYRVPFEIDKDRITNCQAFRRLEYKTQVFVTHEGDNYNNNSVENVDHLEPGYDWDARYSTENFGRGLNLTKATREGLLVHTSMGYRGKIHRQARFNEKYEDAIRYLSDKNDNIRTVFPWFDRSPTS